MANHVKWFFNVTKWNPSRQEWLDLISCVAPEEAERINKFVYQDDAKSSLIGRALIRKFVSTSLNRPSNEISIIRTDHGRPKVCPDYQKSLHELWPKTFDFNVSHSGDYCVLAGFWSKEESPLVSVGVDVTKIVSKKTKPELDRFLSLMSRREFTKSEWETVESVQSDRQKCINFTRLWCLKECYIKSIGLGLTFRLHRIEFHPAKSKRYNLSTDMLTNRIVNNTQVYLDGTRSEYWQFQETALDDEHLVAVGYKFDEDTPQTRQSIDSRPFVEVNIDDLVGKLLPMTKIEHAQWRRFSGLLKKNR